MNKPRSILVEAAFTIETVAHMNNLENQLLPQADRLRKIHALILEASEDLQGGMDDSTAAVRLNDLVNEILE